MHRGLTAYLLLGVACIGDAGPPAPTPGSHVVLEFGQEWGVAWPPAWCPTTDPERRTCLRWLPDSSQVVLHWDPWRRPYSVARTWSGVSPIRGVDLRDSLRLALEHQGARRLSDGVGPDAPEYRAHHTQMRWCLDSAIVTVDRSWQDGYRLEGVGLLIGAVPTPSCSGQKLE